MAKGRFKLMENLPIIDINMGSKNKARYFKYEALGDVTELSEEEDDDNEEIIYSCDNVNVDCTDACKELVRQLREENESLRNQLKLHRENKDRVDLIYSETPFQLATKRLPALSVTLMLELLGGIVIAKLHKVIQAYTLLVSFMPAISALSGNLGLQASANTIRGLGTGHIQRNIFCSNILKEIKSGLLVASTVAVVIGGVGTVWSHLADEEINKDFPRHPYVLGALLFAGTWISMMISTVNGAGTPILAHFLNLDPAKITGPLETAFQDIVGQSFLLGASYIVFHYTEHII